MSTRYFLPDQTRRATILAHGAPLALHTDALPVLEGTEVLVRVHCCGVCHTDVHLRAGYYDIGDGREWRFNEHGVHPPITPGHEIYGEIIAASPRGEGVRRRGVIYPWIGCGECRTCTSGNEHFCAKHRFVGMRRAGGFADYVILPHARYVLDTGSLEPARAATLACAGLTAYSALKKLGDQRRGGWIGVIGAGGLGLHGIQIAKPMGFERVVAFEIDSARRDAALKAGAIRAVDPRDGDAVAQLIREQGDGARGIIDFVGRPETFALGTDALARGGAYVMVGLFGGEARLALPMIPLRTISIHGSAVGSFAEMRELIELVRRSAPPALPMRLQSLRDANTALDDLEAGRIVGRVVLKP